MRNKRAVGMWWLILLALALVVLLKVWPKGLWFVLTAAVVLAGGVLYWQKQTETQLERIVLNVAYAPDRCPSDRPLHVSFHNTAEQPVFRIFFSIHARVPGYSSEVTPYTYKQFTSEKILQPDERYDACYAVPPLSRFSTKTPALDSLEWSAEVNKIHLR